jgi:hypothetical protein
VLEWTWCEVKEKRCRCIVDVENEKDDSTGDIEKYAHDLFLYSLRMSLSFSQSVFVTYICIYIYIKTTHISLYFSPPPSVPTALPLSHLV